MVLARRIAALQDKLERHLDHAGHKEAGGSEMARVHRMVIADEVEGTASGFEVEGMANGFEEMGNAEGVVAGTGVAAEGERILLDDRSCLGDRLVLREEAGVGFEEDIVVGLGEDTAVDLVGGSPGCGRRRCCNNLGST